ncbi:MAG: hypothetical protein E6G89_01690 [Alphaproteobacteria bacterium]|nr:MAG: hypothetical protein E6G89_01690 [Alphaproteobacteria bacterium]
MNDTVLIDNRRDRATLLAHLAICSAVAVIGILAYLYMNAQGVYYSRERDNVGNTYCLYWMPFTNFENSIADQPNAYSCPVIAQPAKIGNPDA